MNNISKINENSMENVYKMASINKYNIDNNNNNSNDKTINHNCAQSSLESIRNMNTGMNVDVYDVSLTTPKSNTNKNKFNINNLLMNNSNYSKIISQPSDTNSLNNPNMIYANYTKSLQTSLNRSNIGSNINVNNIPHDTTIVLPNAQVSNQSDIGKKK